MFFAAGITNTRRPAVVLFIRRTRFFFLLIHSYVLKVYAGECVECEKLNNFQLAEFIFSVNIGRNDFFLFILFAQ